MNGRLAGSIAGAGRRDDAHQHVVDRPRQGAPVAHQLEREAEHVRRVLGVLLEIDVAALAQHVEEQDRALPGVDPVFLDEVEVLAFAHLPLLGLSPVEGDTGQPSISSFAVISALILVKTSGDTGSARMPHRSGKPSMACNNRTELSMPAAPRDRQCDATRKTNMVGKSRHLYTPPEVTGIRQRPVQQC